MAGQKKIPECIIQGKLNCRRLKEALGLLIIAMVTFFPVHACQGESRLHKLNVHYLLVDLSPEHTAQ
jgi:hypothetical protein